MPLDSPTSSSTTPAHPQQENLPPGGQPAEAEEKLAGSTSSAPSGCNQRNASPLADIHEMMLDIQQGLAAGRCTTGSSQLLTTACHKKQATPQQTIEPSLARSVNRRLEFDAGSHLM